MKDIYRLNTNLFIFWFITILSIFYSPIESAVLSAAQSSNIPKWATDQLTLRELVKQSIIETQKWQDSNGEIFSALSTYKWDDEVEIFHFWMTYYQLTGDESVYQSVKGAAMTYLRRAQDMFDHGYYAEPFFDTEHTLEGLIILADLVYLRPDDAEIVTAIEDLVEHVGNWVPGYAPWYNPQTKHMTSINPGTRSVEVGCTTGIDWVFNLQFAKLALATYYVTDNERYLNWVGDYLDGWIESIEKNEIENGFYVIPKEIDPVTGQIGPCSGVWYHSAFTPGWGWQSKGNNSNRDMRGAFLDYFRLTGDRKYLDSIKEQMRTLFDNGSENEPANYFDGTTWIPATEKITVNMCCQSSLLDPQPDPTFDDYLLNWFNSIQYPSAEMYLWYFRKLGDLTNIDAINGYAIRKATNRLEDLQALTSLPDQPDDFPKIGGVWGLSLVPFGGITSHRGELPWTEVLYFKDDNTLGLDEGIAALLEKGNDSLKVFSLCNANDVDAYVKVQADFIPSFINYVTVDSVSMTDFDNQLARIHIPPEQTVQVRMGIGIRDTIPPNPPQNLQQIAASENTIHIGWEPPVIASDGDTAQHYKIIRDDIELAVQDSLSFIDTGLVEQTSYYYEVYAIDKGNNQSVAAIGQFSTAADTTPPRVLTTALVSATNLQIAFDEILENSSAKNIQNYSIIPDIQIDQAILSAGGKTVYLETSPHSEGIVYTVQVENVTDNSINKNVIVPSTSHYTFEQELQIKDISKSNYFIKYLQVGDSLYSDREYLLTFIPAYLQGLPWIVTANDDKMSTGDSFLSLSVNKGVAIYVGYDERLVSLPLWLQGWEKTNKTIRSDDANYICYKKFFSKGDIVLGGNYGNTSSSMYLIAINSSIDRIPPAPPTAVRVSPILSE